MIQNNAYSLFLKDTRHSFIPMASQPGFHLFSKKNEWQRPTVNKTAHCKLTQSKFLLLGRYGYNSRNEF